MSTNNKYRSIALPVAILDAVAARAEIRGWGTQEQIVEYLTTAMQAEDQRAQVRRERAVISSVAPPRIKLMAEYGTPPLWRVHHGSGPIALDTLPLSSTLIDRLKHWTSVYEDLGRRRYDTSIASPTDDEIETFEQEGRILWQQLREELRSHYSVLYHSDKSGELMAHPDDIIKSSSGTATSGLESLG